jgi:hypothetical protein
MRKVAGTNFNAYAMFNLPRKKNNRRFWIGDIGEKQRLCFRRLGG